MPAEPHIRSPFTERLAPQSLTAAQSTSDASIGLAGIGGFEEGEFEGDSSTEEVAAVG
jgi:hypothetical protein